MINFTIFLYGNDSDEVEFYEGDKTILDYLKEDDFADFDASLEQVPEGQRNSTMSHIAGKIIKRYGNTENAYQIFLKKAELCNPPLPELTRRAGNLGRLDRKCKKHNKTVPTAFQASRFNISWSIRAGRIHLQFDRK